MPDTQSRQARALSLARQGFRIFPLAPGSKRPLLPHEKFGGWREYATENEPVITGWFSEYPGMNYAVVCDMKHAILDPDEGIGKNGIANFKQAEEHALGFVEDSIFDGTFRVRTPRGGVHLYFITERAYSRSLGSLIPDVDVSGFNGYVVGPGSFTRADPEHNTAEGTYIVERDVPMTTLPVWLVELMSGLDDRESPETDKSSAVVPLDLPSSITKACEVLRTIGFAMQGHKGDDHTYRTAGRLKDHGVSEAKCLDLLYSELLFEPTDDAPEGRSWNDCCEPPWTLQDLQRKITNVYSYGNNAPGIRVDAMAAFDNRVEDVTDKSHLELSPISDIPDLDTQNSARQKIEDLVMSGSDFLQRKMESYCLVPEWIPAQGVTAVLATRGCGKSMVMEDLCMRIALDMPWNDIELTPDFACAYLCGEDDVGLQRNLKAWKETYNCFPEDSRLVVAPAVPKLMDAESVRQWAEVLRKRFEGRKVVVFLDTWHRATSGSDQNDNQDMSKCLEHAIALARSLNGCCIAAFHPPKNRNDTISGSAILEDDGNAILRIDEAPGGKRLIVHRIKGSRGEGNYYLFNKKEVSYGDMDDYGREVTGVIPVYYGGSGKINPDKLAEDDAMRSIMIGYIEEVLPERKRGVTFKELSETVFSQCSGNHDMATYLNNPKDSETVESYLHQIFRPGAQVDVGGAKVVLEEGRFKLKGV